MRPRTTSRAEHEAEQERRQNVCAAIVCSVLGGALRRAVDIRGGPPGRHDYDLHFDDGHVEALEVCALTDEEAEAQRGALKGRKLRDSVVLTRYWLVGIPERGLDLGARADDSFFNRVEALLAVYEAHGRFRFDPNDQWMLIGEVGRGHPLVDAATELAAMGIRLLSSLVPQPGMSPAMELQVTRGIHVDRESVNRAVEDRANDAGNLAKLRDATQATARHLFVPMYPAALMEFWAVEYIEPTSTPVLPPEVTRAWVVGGANDVLYVEPLNDWDRVPYDSRAMSDPERWKAR